MAEIHTDYEDYENRGVFNANSIDPSAIPQDKREDAETIEKVQAIAIPTNPPLITTTLAGRVTDAAQQQAQDWMLEQLETFDPTAATITPPESNDVEANYMFQIRSLIAQILVQLNRISQKDRDQIEKLKGEYKKLTQETASLQKQIGTNNLMFSVITLGAAFFQIAENPIDRQFAKIFAENVCPRLGEMFASDIQANTTRSMNLANLLLQEYTAKTQKGQADSSNKQEMIQLLDRALNGLSQAARAG